MAGPKLKYQATPSDVNKCTRLEREVFEQGFSPLSITVLLSPEFYLDIYCRLLHYNLILHKLNF